jgi:hypothetical protein
MRSPELPEGSVMLSSEVACMTIDLPSGSKTDSFPARSVILSRFCRSNESTREPREGAVYQMHQPRRVALSSALRNSKTSRITCSLLHVEDSIRVNSRFQSKLIRRVMSLRESEATRSDRLPPARQHQSNFPLLSFVELRPAVFHLRLEAT